MQSLTRLLSILEAVAAHDGPVGAADVASDTGLSLSTVARLMTQFSRVGLLARDERTRRHTIGPRLYALARSANADFDVATVAEPILNEMRDLTGETVSVHVLRGTHRLCLAEAQSNHPLRRVVPIGTAEPLQSSATGAVLLADRPAEDVQRACADLTPDARSRFEAKIAHAESFGWVVVSHDFVTGLTGLSVAVTDDDGRVFAALSVSGPSTRFPEDVAERWVPRMKDAAMTIATKMGRRVPRLG